MSAIKNLLIISRDGQGMKHVWGVERCIQGCGGEI